MIPDTYRGEGRTMLDRNEVNQWLERAASGGVADRSQMIDRVVDGSRGDARAQLAAEAARDRAELLPGARQSAGRSPIEAVVLEVQTFAKWNGIDQGLVDATAAQAVTARGELPAGIHTARDAVDAYAARVHERATGSAEGSIAPDAPESGSNRVLNRALTEDLGRRTFNAYTEGYAGRLRSGMEWLQATPAERVVMEANTLAMRVEAYSELDRINADVEADVDGVERLHDPDTFAQRFVTERVDGGLERAAYLAGRWADQDPVIAGQLDRLRSTLTDVAAAPAVDDHDMREVRFGFSDQMLRGGDAGVLGMARAQNERAAGVLAPAANAAAGSDLDAVRNVLRAQHGATRGAGSGAERRYETPAAGPSSGLER